MSDIFISYKSSDRERIQPLVKALEQRGWSVWWDRDIIAGEVFDKVIMEALNGAKCVIVVWSKDSVMSDWVKDEADVGKRRGILIPVLIDNVGIPLGFGRIQTATLVDWQGTLPHPGFDQLSEAISRILSRSPGSIQEQESQEHKAREEANKLGAERKIQEEPPAFYQHKVEVTTNKGIPSSVQFKNWFKIIVGAGIAVLIIALVVIIHSMSTVPTPPTSVKPNTITSQEPTAEQKKRETILKDTQQKIEEINKNITKEKAKTQDEQYKKWDEYIRPTQ